VVVRASIAVNPSTAALTVTSNPLPQVVDGVPLRLRRVLVDVDRPGFILNATDCSPQKVEATLSGLEGFTASSGTSVSVSSPYQASGCASLAFKPKFSASTSGHTSKALGASLTTRVEEPAGALGTQADITKVKVELPIQLPSELKTLQHACLAKVFEENPAGCPEHSIVGRAVVHTPVLPVPLEGPAYFVSHGGEAFPSLTMVLQGDGVSVDLVGTTFINGKTDVTSTTFKTVPDVPFTSFELVLPQGAYPALGAYLPEKANDDFCTQKLIMPTEMIAQNGAELHQDTRIEVQGCPDTVQVFSTTVKKRTLSLYVYAPAAGKLTASAPGLTSTSNAYSGREAQTLTLTQKHPGRLHTKIKLTYTPTHGGHKQTKTLNANFKG